MNLTNDQNLAQGSTTGKKLEPFEQDFLFKRAIESLRREHRTRPSYDAGVCVSSGGCFSTRQRTEMPTDRKQPEPFETRPEQFDGPVIPIWHQPSHLAFNKRPNETANQFEARVSVRPRYTGQHVVVIGNKSVPIKEIYSQGDHRAHVCGKDVVIKDFWAVQYKSGWRGFIDPRIRLNQGDRERDEFFEPTEQQMSAWREKYTRDGKFKPVQHGRFSQMLPKHLFKNYGDEVPRPTRRMWIKGDNFDFTNPYGFSKPKRSWKRDPSFIFELTRVFPSLKLAVYHGGENIKVDFPPLRPPQRLFAPYCTFFIPPVWANQNGKFCWRDRFETNTPPPAPANIPRSAGNAADVGEISPQGYAPFANGSVRQPDYWERMLQTAEDYHSEQHAKLAHFYEYSYRYHPPDFPWDIGHSISPIRNTTITKANAPQPVLMTWDDAIRNTFARVVEETPPDGLYVMYKLNPMAATRVYPVLIPPPIEFDFDLDGEPVFLTENDFSAENPVPLGVRDVHEQIRTAVGRMRTKSKTPMTIGDNLRDIVRTGGPEDIRYIRFSWDEIRGLTWVVS